MTEREVCGEPFAIGVCDRPPHDDDEHTATFTPSAPMALILEAAARAEHRANRWRWFFTLATVAQVALFLYRLIEGVPQ
ncbi:hypothetical protein SEA_FIREMAN_73 [Microbacterium phage Fireman]|uniref:Uncharacterized protein n=2 Tax=Metamorphoovirus TaxID=2733195 RepID=A0A481VWZ8_9CAUD|nr:membrane protein [Microbacterium phage RobsFeet]YP_009820309.1 membrane protein [Microbacterium phage Fireman]AWY06080.1 hypothetical protein SEA_ROBSFEET_74 [Microbacterium phage RobsFeet]QBI98155.1 hypothetical protein SEA_FIREMAN_73 [Microbacterium phage Fireman]